MLNVVVEVVQVVTEVLVVVVVAVPVIRVKVVNQERAASSFWAKATATKLKRRMQATMERILMILRIVGAMSTREGSVME